MASTLLEEVVAGRAPAVARFTVDQVHRMLETGILPDAAPVELIEGVLVHKDRADAGDGTLSHGKRHRLVVKNLIRLERRLPAHVHLLVQLPVTLTSMSEPEPDAAIVRGAPGDYADRNPGPSDLLVVIEVSDSSFAYDRTTKLQLYAQAAIATYWILNARDGRLEVYTEPLPAEGRFALRSELGPGDVARLDLGQGAKLEVLVADLLNG
jgi:Uma2 family endonuclease